MSQFESNPPPPLGLSAAENTAGVSSENTRERLPPPRKRRRPALACFECRRRKVKCDRNSPCFPCTQSKCSCIYSSDINIVAAASHTNQYNDGDNSQRQAPPDHFRPAESARSLLERNQNNFVPSSVSAQNTFSGAGASSQSPVPSGNGIPSGNEKTIEELLHRIQTLEQKLSDSQKSARKSEATTNEVPPLTNSYAALSSSEPLRAVLSKTRMFGPSHWMAHFQQFHEFQKMAKIAPFNYYSFDAASFVSKPRHLEICTLLDKCKRLSRALKAQRPSRYLVPPDQDFKAYIPSRGVAEKYVDAYLRCFESIYRVLHIPSFRLEYAQYWENPGAASVGFVVKLLLVMAIGASLYQDPDGSIPNFDDTLRWVYAAQNWLSVPFEKNRLNLSGLQIYCLLLVARQNVFVGPELVWISAGSLIRTAMQMGLHRDPRYFPKMSVLHMELRRRLWATILELAVQSSIDSGMPPMISFSDFDSEPPSNIDDVDIDETTILPPLSKPNNVFTQTSLQINLFKSLRTRLEVARTVNDSLSDPSYDRVLQLSSEVLQACRDSSILFKTAAQQPLAPTAFHRNITDYYLRRFLLTLHHPFAFKSREDPRFYFSRKMCLESALTMCSAEDDKDYRNLMSIGGGLFRALSIHSAITFWFEIIVQEEEARSSGILDHIRQNASTAPIREACKNLVSLLAKRLENGETNAKGSMFMTMLMAQIEAIAAGTSQEDAILDAATKSVRSSYHIMRSKLHTIPEDCLLENERRQGAEGAVLPANGNDAQDLEYGLLQQDGNLNFDFFPDFWMFSQGWDENSWVI